LLRNSEEPLARKTATGVFVGPPIRKLLRDEQFDRILRDKTAWNEFGLVATNFTGNKNELVEN
jgi:hypothetical protein